MNKTTRNSTPFVILAVLFLLASVAWTAGVVMYDVQPVGPEGSTVGFATINSAVFAKLGTSELFDKLGDGILLLTILVCVVLLVAALRQALQRRSLLMIDSYWWCLALVFIVVLGLYVLFDHAVINYRPVLDEGVLEPSFPSSHTMAVITVMGCACVAVRRITSNGAIVGAATVVCILAIIVMPVSRLLAGVHWFSDVVAAVLYGLFLVFAYAAMVGRTRHTTVGRHSVQGRRR